jgi:Beta-carotene isomerase D27-like, C-terminal
MHLQQEPVRQTSSEYRDSWFDRLFIWLFSRKMARAVGQETQLQGYEGFVDLSKQIMQGRNPQEQQRVVRKVLHSLVPAPVLFAIRSLFSPTQLVCELNAWFATRLFEWLVGPCEVLKTEIIDLQGTVKWQKSNVHIKKCRYLEQSGCVGMCINMCKLPTQEFFTKEFGIPLTMTPNFEDLSCDMVFGQLPPALETEAAYHQPCLSELCPTAQVGVESCPKVRR